MKSKHHGNVPTRDSGHHPWLTTLCVLFGVGIAALAVFWLRKCKPPRHEYAAVTIEPSTTIYTSKQSHHELDETMHNYQKRLPVRYRLVAKLGYLGRRRKEWFIVRDTQLDAERMMCLADVPAVWREMASSCQELLVKVFRAIHHPYVLPIMDVDLWDSVGLLCVIAPLSREGSLRDIIYGRRYDDAYQEHRGRGRALSFKQVQYFGRQILESLIFLESCNFPPLGSQLHCGNIIVQNGVARLAGLENVLLGEQRTDRTALQQSNRFNDLLAFGRILYEMSTGCEFQHEKLYATLTYISAPECVDLLDILLNQSLHSFVHYTNNHSNNPSRTIQNLEAVVRHDMFKAVELRELLRGRGFDVMGAQDALQLLLEAAHSPHARDETANQSKRTKSRVEHRERIAETIEHNLVTEIDIYNDFEYNGEDIEEQLTVTLIESR